MKQTVKTLYLAVITALAFSSVSAEHALPTKSAAFLETYSGMPVLTRFVPLRNSASLVMYNKGFCEAGKVYTTKTVDINYGLMTIAENYYTDASVKGVDRIARSLAATPAPSEDVLLSLYDTRTPLLIDAGSEQELECVIKHIKGLFAGQGVSPAEQKPLLYLLVNENYYAAGSSDAFLNDYFTLVSPHDEAIVDHFVASKLKVIERIGSVYGCGGKKFVNDGVVDAVTRVVNKDLEELSAPRIASKLMDRILDKKLGLLVLAAGAYTIARNGHKVIPGWGPITPPESYTAVLNDGTVIKGLELNGNVFGLYDRTQEPPAFETLESKLSGKQLLAVNKN